MSIFQDSLAVLDSTEPVEASGQLVAVRGLTVLADELALPVGSLVRVPVRRIEGDAVSPRLGEIVGFDGSRAIVMLLGSTDGIAPQMRIIGDPASSGQQSIRVGNGMLGRIIDGLGRPLDRPAHLGRTAPRALFPGASNAMRRDRIREPLPTGIRAIDGFLTAGKGQRLGVFSAAGVGKSTLLASIARHGKADVNVIAMIGERGREVREFIEEALGSEGLARSVVVVATADESPLLRARAAFAACTIAEFFRDSGKHVMLMMDSITRFAQALRQIGLAAGEPPATRGYPPSVFARMPELLERAGAVVGAGSITGFYAVLVEGDDLDEPISDAARGILDGHIVLSRSLAARSHFPAIDVLNSISRVAGNITDPHHRAARERLVRLLAAYRDAEELINIGAYVRGSDPDTDLAIQMRPHLLEFLRQSGNENVNYAHVCRRMIELAGMAEHAAMKPLPKRPT